jgi:cation:H+ antiporter
MVTPIRPPANPRSMALLWLALALTLPGVVLRVVGFHPEDGPLFGLGIFGLTIVSAAFLLTWAAETAEQDMGSGLAIVFLALVTVLPEYAVDMYLAWQAGHDPAYQGKALANMTGANRLLIGTGWPIVALITWYRFGRASVVLRRQRAGDVVWLLAATLYSVVIPLKGSLDWYDAAVLVTIYVIYVRGSARDEGEHDPAALIGPPAVMVGYAKRKRVRVTTALFVWAGFAILASAEAFSESLIGTGRRFHVDEVLLIQWLAPLASEAPEFVVVVLLTLRGRGEMGLGAFISSKVNQWTLLVGGVPLVFAASHYYHGGGFVSGMPLDARMTEELWLTVTQGLYAVATIADLRFSLAQALTILGLFLVQFVGSLLLESGLLGVFGLGHAHVAPFHLALSVLYAVLALERFVSQRHHLLDRWRDARHGVPAPAETRPPDRHTPDESDA